MRMYDEFPRAVEFVSNAICYGILQTITGFSNSKCKEVQKYGSLKTEKNF